MNPPHGGLPVRPRWIVLACGLAVALAVGAGFAGHALFSSSTRSPSPERSHSGMHTRLASALPVTSPFLTIEAPSRIFTIAYPRSWQRVADSDPQVVLLAKGSNGGSLLIQETPLRTPVTAANLSSAKRFATHAVDSGVDIKQLRAPQLVSLGGAAGFLYLYTFLDPVTGQTDAHAHYFLFDGSTLITLVFQAVPAARILALSHLFDRIAATFRLVGG